jgi:hypothetical protein
VFAWLGSPTGLQRRVNYLKDLLLQAPSYLVDAEMG